MRRIPADEWKPVGGITLEPNAEAAVKSDYNCLVVAGPGAGKTELLAQRACYLLETGLCPEPRIILAISFKRDAAKNLAERVARRCGRDLARRFHSLTYDAFAKSIVDRFKWALPDDYRPSDDYEVETTARKEDFQEWLGYLDISLDEFDAVDIETVRQGLCKYKLPLNADNLSDLHDRVISKLWAYMLHEIKPSRLTFPMISRLAELILRSNPLLLNALRTCYSHVFLDEFQDTTGVQYELLLSAFRESRAVLTAVGDYKQRIMGWAGALPYVMEAFLRDFRAVRRDLFCNHRSVPRLVRMQQVFAHYLDPTLPKPALSVNEERDTGICKVVLFTDFKQEARAIARKIAHLIQTEKLSPRDIAILVKQKVSQYTSEIIRELNALGVRARNESDMQDLLSEPCVEVAMSVFQLAMGERNPRAWQDILHLLAGLRGIVSEDLHISSLEQEFQEFLITLETECREVERSPSEEGVSRLMARLFEFIGFQAFKNYHPQYRQGAHLEEVVKDATRHLSTYLSELRDFRAAVGAFRGDDSVPIMTIHKSKGLEYDTVFFVGLEDGAFWSYERQSDEDDCAFFVAFSRAKRRVYFTFSRLRNSGRGGSLKDETRDRIRTLYDLLMEAGAEMVDYTAR